MASDIFETGHVEMDWNRALSLTLACAYIALALFAVWDRRSGAVGILLWTMIGTCVAVAMVWYGEDVSSPSMGVVSSLGIDRGTPGCVVKLLGWLILLLPIMAGLGLWLSC